jgi:hypothetical protein
MRGRVASDEDFGERSAFDVVAGNGEWEQALMPAE